MIRWLPHSDGWRAPPGYVARAEIADGVRLGFRVYLGPARHASAAMAADEDLLSEVGRVAWGVRSAAALGDQLLLSHFKRRAGHQGFVGVLFYQPLDNLPALGRPPALDLDHQAGGVERVMPPRRGFAVVGVPGVCRVFEDVVMSVWANGPPLNVSPSAFSRAEI